MIIFTDVPVNQLVTELCHCLCLCDVPAQAEYVLSFASLYNLHFEIIIWWFFVPNSVLNCIHSNSLLLLSHNQAFSAITETCILLMLTIIKFSIYTDYFICLSHMKYYILPRQVDFFTQARKAACISCLQWNVNQKCESGVQPLSNWIFSTEMALITVEQK